MGISFKTVLLFVACVFVINLSIAAPPEQYNEIKNVPVGEGLNGIFYINDTAGNYTIWQDSNNIYIENPTGAEGVTLKAKYNPLVNKFGSVVTLYHKNDLGIIDSVKLVELGEPDAQGNIYFYNLNFSTIIIGQASIQYVINQTSVTDGTVIDINENVSGSINLLGTGIQAQHLINGSYYPNKKTAILNSSYLNETYNQLLSLNINLPGFSSGRVLLTDENETQIPAFVESVGVPNPEDTMIWYRLNTSEGVSTQVNVYWNESLTAFANDSEYGRDAVFEGYELFYLMNSNPTAVIEDVTGNGNNGSVTGFVSGDLQNDTYSKMINFDGTDASINVGRVQELEGYQENWTIVTRALFDVDGGNRVLWSYDFNVDPNSANLGDYYVFLSADLSCGIGSSQIDCLFQNESDNVMSYMSFGRSITNWIDQENESERYNSSQDGSNATGGFYDFSIGDSLNLAHFDGKMSFLGVHPDELSHGYRITQSYNQRNPTGSGTLPFYTISDLVYANSTIYFTPYGLSDSSNATSNTTVNVSSGIINEIVTNVTIHATNLSVFNVSLTVPIIGNYTIIDETHENNYQNISLNFTSIYDSSPLVLNVNFTNYSDFLIDSANATASNGTIGCTNYNCTLTVTDYVNNTAFSSLLSFQYFNAPVLTSPTFGTTTINLSSTTFPGVTGYFFRYAHNATSDYNYSNVTTSTTQLTNLTLAETYDIWVVVNRSDGTLSDWSNMITVTTSSGEIALDAVLVQIEENHQETLAEIEETKELINALWGGMLMSGILVIGYLSHIRRKIKEDKDYD